MLTAQDFVIGEKYEPTEHFITEMGREYTGASLVFLEALGPRRLKFRVTYKNGQTQNDIYGHIWQYLRPTSKTVKQDAVLAKIKYLDDRFKQRKQQNERNSVGLGNNNLQQGESVRQNEQGYSTRNIEQNLPYIRQLHYDLYSRGV